MDKDKQIIIDDQKKTIHRLQDECTEKTNAIIALGERLKAKEQECEGLKEQLKEMNEVIRTETTRCSLVYFLQTDLDQLKQTNETLLNVQYKLADNNKKLRQCLTEIKEIAEINPINTCWTVLELCEKCDENKECDIQCPLFKFKLILQKISECEGNDE